MRLPWPFSREPAPVPDVTPASRRESAVPRAGGEWASLPPLQRTLGDMPLVAPAAPFLDAVPGTRPLPPILQPLGHEVNPLASPGLVVAHPRFAAASAESSQARGPGPVAPVQRRRAPIAAPIVAAAPAVTDGPAGADRDDARVAEPFAESASSALPPAPPARRLEVLPGADAGRGAGPADLTSALAVVASPAPLGPAARPSPVQRRATDGIPAPQPSGRGMRRAPSGTETPPTATPPARRALPAPPAHAPAPAADTARPPRRPGLGAPIATQASSPGPAADLPPLVAHQVVGRRRAEGSSLPPSAPVSEDGAPVAAPAALAAPAHRLLPLAGVPVEAVASRAATRSGIGPVRPIAGRAVGLAVLAQRLPTHADAGSGSTEAPQPSSPPSGPLAEPSWTGSPRPAEPAATPGTTLPQPSPVTGPPGGATGRRAAGAAIPWIQRPTRSAAAAGTGGLRAPASTPASAPGPVQRAAATPSGPLPLATLARPRLAGPGAPPAASGGSAGGSPLLEVQAAHTSHPPGPAALASGPVAAPVATPVVQRISGAAPLAQDRSPGRSDRELDQLARALFGRLRTQLKAELIHEREAKGIPFDNH